MEPHVFIGDLNFLLDKENFTAIVSDSKNAAGDILIPRDFLFEDQKYTVISVGENAFSFNKTLISLSFSHDSEVRSFGKRAFFICSKLSRLKLPPNLEEIEKDCFSGTQELSYIDSSLCKNYVYENGLLMDKNKTTILFGSRKPVNFNTFTIPKTISSINPFSMQYSNVKSIIFEDNSSLEVIGERAFINCKEIDNIIFPPSVKSLGTSCFYENGIKSLVFQGKSIEIGKSCFANCKELESLYFINLENGTFGPNCFDGTSSNLTIYINAEANINKDFQISGKIIYLAKSNQNCRENQNQTNEENEKKITLLESQLHEANEQINSIKKEIEELKQKKKSKKRLLTSDEIKSFEKPTKIGQNAISILEKCEVTYLTTETIALKSFIFHDFIKNKDKFINECKQISLFDHKSIASIRGFLYNNNSDESSINKWELNCPIIAYKYYESNLEDEIKSKTISNTNKVMIVLEIASGMEYIHNKGVIHQNLKPKNILLNKNKHAKISDFGIGSLYDSDNNLKYTMRFVAGTHQYMSPELLNEEKYNNNTDVYSFGKLLYFILTGENPPFKMNEVVTGAPFVLPSSLKLLAQEIIKKCCSFIPEIRPSFTDIITILKSHSFDILDDIDLSLISSRLQKIESFKQ